MNQLGLTKEEVLERLKKHQYNENIDVPTKSIKNIILSNTITLFNLLNLGLGIGVFLVGSYKNLAFLVVIFLNTIISIVQEVQAKKIIDRLSFLVSSKALVIRDGKKVQIEKDQIVKDDIIIYQNGDQVLVDSVILEGEVEVNESLITGEEDAISKLKEDNLLSGSFITSGMCTCRVKHVGKENYIASISYKVKKEKKKESEIEKTFQLILKIISFIIIPLGILLFIKQWYICNFVVSEAVIKTTAALIGMIPEGLILLTSTVLAVSTIKLSKYKVLSQKLHSIETLARIDTLCLDKTGTLTEGKMEVVDVIYLKDQEKSKNVLNAITYYSKDTNATMLALKKYFKEEPIYKEIKQIPFSSKKKYSGSILYSEGTYYIGALEFLKVNKKIDLSKYEEKYRTLVLTHDEEVYAVILLQDKIRKEAKDTLNYFKKQGVDIKIISGDNVKTVENIAKRCGLENVDSVDMSKVTDIESIGSKNVFGRVTPEQKKELIIYFKKQGHQVAMTGDGVNDVLALRESDLSIAMGNGSEAARNISELILLDSNFDALPHVVKEGRKSINNLQRSASLFLSKTIYSFLLSVIFLIIPYPYPFMPVQLTLTSVFTIGIPSFILALEPNDEKVHGKFLGNVIATSIPAALTIVINILIIVVLTAILNLSTTTSSTLCVMMVGITGFILIFKICKPFNLLRGTLLVSLIIGFIISSIGLKRFLSLATFNFRVLTIVGILFIVSFTCFTIIDKIINNWLKKRGLLC